MFDKLMTDTVTLKKRNGLICEGIKAMVGYEAIHIDLCNNPNLPPIESGDIILHNQSNGVAEKYQVLDPCYYDCDFAGKHYQCKVKKLLSNEQSQTKSVFCINSNQVNIANDNATIYATQSDGVDILQVKSLIESVKQSIGAEMLADDVESIVESLNALEEQLSQPVPSKAVVKGLLTAIKTTIGTAKFGAAVATLIQYVQTII